MPSKNRWTEKSFWTDAAHTDNVEELRPAIEYWLKNPLGRHDAWIGEAAEIAAIMKNKSAFRCLVDLITPQSKTAWALALGHWGDQELVRLGLSKASRPDTEQAIITGLVQSGHLESLAPLLSGAPRHIRARYVDAAYEACLWAPVAAIPVLPWLLVKASDVLAPSPEHWRQLLDRSLLGHPCCAKAILDHLFFRKFPEQNRALWEQMAESAVVRLSSDLKRKPPETPASEDAVSCLASLVSSMSSSTFGKIWPHLLSVSQAHLASPSGQGLASALAAQASLIDDLPRRTKWAMDAVRMARLDLFAITYTTELNDSLWRELDHARTWKSLSLLAFWGDDALFRKWMFHPTHDAIASVTPNAEPWPSPEVLAVRRSRIELEDAIRSDNASDTKKHRM